MFSKLTTIAAILIALAVAACCSTPEHAEAGCRHRLHLNPWDEMLYCPACDK